MSKNRIIYGLAVFLTIAAGLLSRRSAVVPAATGDALWAVMIFLILRFVFIDGNMKHIAISSLAICYAVEISQLYHQPWIDNIRETRLGALVLGRGFLWSDILAYTLGIGICILVVNAFRRYQNVKNNAQRF